MSLFHYTDAVAVASILNNEEIWLTDVRFLNDSKEFYDGVEFVQRSVRILEGAGFAEGSPKLTCDYISEVIMKSFERELDDSPKFLCSFSQKGDLLSQWRAYGSYAIEFDRARLAEELKLISCVYCEDKKEDGSLSSILDNFTYLEEAHSRDGSLLGPESAEVKMELVDLCLSYKSKHFAEEAEVRLFVSEDEYSEEICFRSKAGLLVPYIPYHISLSSIKAVHLGPMANQQLAEKSICMLVQKIRAKYLLEGKDAPDIEVICSEIPYRAL